MEGRRFHENGTASLPRLYEWSRPRHDLAFRERGPLFSTHGRTRPHVPATRAESPHEFSRPPRPAVRGGRALHDAHPVSAQSAGARARYESGLRARAAAPAVRRARIPDRRPADAGGPSHRAGVAEPRPDEVPRLLDDNGVRRAGWRADYRSAGAASPRKWRQRRDSEHGGAPTGRAGDGRPSHVRRAGASRPRGRHRRVRRLHRQRHRHQRLPPRPSRRSRRRDSGPSSPAAPVATAAASCPRDGTSPSVRTAVRI